MQMQCLFCGGASIIDNKEIIELLFIAFITSTTVQNMIWSQRTRGIMSDGGMVLGAIQGWHRQQGLHRGGRTEEYSNISKNSINAQ